MADVLILVFARKHVKIQPADPFPNVFFLFHEPSPHLPCSVSTIDDDIGAGGVRACVGGQVDIGALELSGLGVTAERNHAVPELLDVLGHKVRQAGVDVAGGDRVDTCEIAPFVGQGSRQVDAAGFGDVVGCLFVKKKSQVSICV